MKKNILLLFLVLLVPMLNSCASMSGSSGGFGYEKEAIILHLKSDSDLNIYQRTPHTLLLCVYQLRDPNAFNQLMDDKEGMQKLLECSRFDPGVTSVKSIVVLPNQEKTEKLDRAEDTKYVGIITGYYSLKKDYVTRFIQIPLGLFGKPKALKVDLRLGAQGIKEKGKN